MQGPPGTRFGSWTPPGAEASTPSLGLRSLALVETSPYYQVAPSPCCPLPFSRRRRTRAGPPCRRWPCQAPPLPPLSLADITLNTCSLLPFSLQALARRPVNQLSGGSPPRGGSAMLGLATSGSDGGGGHGTDTHPPTGAHSGSAGERAAEAPSEPGAGQGGGVRPGTGPEAQHGGRNAAGGGGAQPPQNLQAAQPLQRPQDVPRQETRAGQALRETHPGGAAARPAATAALRAARRRLHQQQRAAAAAAVPGAEHLPPGARPGGRCRGRFVVIAFRRVPGPPEDSRPASRRPRRIFIFVFRRRRPVRLGPCGCRGQQQRWQ